ncbi:Transmembrane channel-like protein 3 [Halocaridina rubra]|uniref:Transmembrane channel-like protein 3 n=1 Tax=Halocaridina rubra TaxID=373956 RepID=A0AAN8XF87_HALRR
MGMFFSPGLPAANTLKLIILLYVRSWAVVTSNVPPEVVFKASNNNNFYLMFLLTMLFLCTLPVGYAVVWLEPSWHCGPFSDYPKIYQLATSTLIGGLPRYIYPVIDYISSPGVVIPAGLLLVLIIYYLLSLTAALREANSDLRDQLRQERSADKRKALEARSGKGRAETPTTRWGRVVPLTPMPRQRLDGVSDTEKPLANAKSPPPEPVLARISPCQEPPRGKDDGPWPDDVTDLGHSEVFDDSLSEPRKAGKETPVKEKGDKPLEGRKHSKDKGKATEKESEYESAHKSAHGRSRHRRSSHGSKDEDEIKAPRIKHRPHGSTQQRPNSIKKERKNSDESSHRDSPTRIRQIHRSSIVDSPALRRKKSSGGHTAKLKEKMPEECVQELNEVLQQKEAKHSKPSKPTGKPESQKPETQTPKGSQSRHRREPSILKMDDLRRGSQEKTAHPKSPAQSGQQPGTKESSSDDSQGMQTIPVIKISKEDSVERSLQQAKLERQAKATEEDPETGSEPQSVSTTEPTTPSPIQSKNNGKKSPSSHPISPPPLETDLDEPCSPTTLEDPNVTSDKVKLLEKEPKEVEIIKDDEIEGPPDTPSSNEEHTLLDDK